MSLKKIKHDGKSFKEHNWKDPINNFNGAILAEVNGYFIGYVLHFGNQIPDAVQWDKEGKCWVDYHNTDPDYRLYKQD